MDNADKAEPEIRSDNGIITVHPSGEVAKIKGLGSTFFEKMHENKDKVAQVDAITGEKQTWGLLLQKSIRTAIAMRSKGILSGDVISICSYNYLDTCIPIIAALFLGAKTANLDPTISLEDTAYLLKQVRPKIVFVGPEAIKLLEDALESADIQGQIVVFGQSADHIQFSEFLQPSAEEHGFLPVEIKNVKDTAMIVFSSGTTGLPKGICLSHYGLLASKDPNLLKFYAGNIFLSFSSFYWISATTLLLASVLGGIIRLVYSRFDADNIWNLITDSKPNFLFVAPNQIMSMCRKPKNAVTSSVKLIAISGGPISKDQMIEVNKLFPGTLLGNFYATSELSGTGLWWFPEKDYSLMLEKPDAAGRPLQGFHYKVVDPDTEEILGPNQQGELRIKTDFHMNGYHNLDSSEAWDSDGFIKTGDIAYYDEDYCFFIVDRIKEVMKFQSWHVLPAKLEAVLLSHPAVKAAVVFGIPHREDGEHPMGLVVLKEFSTHDITEQDLEKYVEERVDNRQKLRAGVKIVKTIPVNANSKYNRKRIRDMVIEKKFEGLKF